MTEQHGRSPAMATKHLLWVDVGMAIMVGSFIALIAFGYNSESLIPMMMAFAVAIVVWAFVAELALSRAEEVERSRGSKASTTTKPLPH